MDNALTLVAEAREKILVLQILLDMHGSDLPNQQRWELVNDLESLEELVNDLAVRLRDKQY